MPTEPTPTKSSTTKTTKTSTLGKRKQAPMTTSPSQEQRPPQRTSRHDLGYIGDEDEEKEQRPPNNNNSDSEDHNENSANSGFDHRDEYDSEEEYVIDRKDLLIVKDGTIRVAESLEQQQFDANGEAIKASGTWTKAEHDRFLKAMETYPKGPWKAIAAMVGSRTVRQTQTHAQKYREKMARRMRGLRNRNGTLQYPASSSATMAGDGSMYGYTGASNMGTVMSHDRMTAVYQPANAMTHGRHHHFPHHQQHQHQHSYQQQLYQAMPAGMAMAPAHGGSTMVSSSMEFSQLSKASISSAFIGNPSYPPVWDPRHGTIASVPLVVPSLPQPQLLRRSTSSHSSPETGAARPLPVVAPVSVPATPAAAASSGSSSSVSLSRVGRTPKDPDFDESMDFLMHVYSADPQQLGDTVLHEDTAFFKRE